MRVTKVVFGSRPGYRASAITPGRAKMKTGVSFNSTQNIAPQRLAPVAEPQYALNIDFVHAPIEDAAVELAKTIPQNG